MLRRFTIVSLEHVRPGDPPLALGVASIAAALRYSQTLTAISIFKYVNIVCIIQVHTRPPGCAASNKPVPGKLFRQKRDLIQLARFTAAAAASARLSNIAM